MELWQTLGEATRASLGFFWKSGWAFVLGYTISAAIQAFVPQEKLTRHMGTASAGSISLSTLFGAISSSCSFAALAAARTLFAKGAHFVATVAFMFASTNLVIELGILIYIFLGWEFLVAELIGGLILIAVSSILMKLSYPRDWIEASRQMAEDEVRADEGDFDWRMRIASLDGWARVGRNFVMEWQMVWREILIGFTLAGIMAAFVPETVWKAIFLADQTAAAPGNFWLALQNAAVAPLVAAATFIGSMGNIPLATILASSGVLFAGIMGFIYSDLMVPPLIKVNARYYGWRVAVYIAGIMYVSIVFTALLLHYAFYFTELMPESTRDTAEIATFAIDYTFGLNLLAIGATGALLWLRRQPVDRDEDASAHDQHDHGDGGLSAQDYVAGVAAGLLCFGGIAWAMT